LRAGITEPETVFFGESHQPHYWQTYLMTNGRSLGFATRRQPHNTEAQLDALKDGGFSYRLDIPHQALSSGLDVPTNAVH